VLSTTLESVAQLADVVFARTAGNPFFVRQFLTALHDDRLLRFGDGQWDWDINKIRDRAVTDNVVDLLIEQVSRLPETTQESLKIASCVGSGFDSSLLEDVCGRSLTLDLRRASDAGLLLSLDGDVGQRFRFAHDRVQQAVLTTLDAPARQVIHLDLGRRLADTDARSEQPHGGFEAVAHLNEALELLTDPAERLRLARWNLDAANAAIACSAKDSIPLARAGIRALGATSWQSEYELTRDLHLVGAEAAFAWADHSALEEFCGPVLAQCRSALDVVRVMKLQGRVHQSQQRSAQAITTYVSALAKLGTTIPDHVERADVEREQRATERELGQRPVRSLLDLPICEDPVAAATMDLLSRLIFFTFSSGSNLFALVVCRLLGLSLRHGNTAHSANGYTFFGLILTRDGDIDRACQFGRLALELAHRFDDPAVLSQSYLYVHYQLGHWKTPLAELAGSFRVAHRYGLQAGSPMNAACSATTLCICRFWGGEELAGVAADMDAYRSMIVRFRQDLVLNWHEVLMQAIANLRWDPADPTALVGSTYDERERLPRHVAAKDRSALFNYHLAKAFLCYLFGKHAEALESMNAILADWQFVVGLVAIPLVYLDSLVRLGCASRADEATAAPLVASVLDNLQKLTAWSTHNPRCIDHKIATLKAELARISGNIDRARDLFVEAVRLARASDIVHEEAITCELAGRFGVTIRDGGMARSYLRSAHRAYLRWGAATKAKALEREHPQVLQSSVPVGAASRDNQDFDVLDLVTVLNASTALSSEIRLDRLLCRLMSLLIETGGAQTGYLLLKKDGRWVVEAGQDADRGVVTVLQSLPTFELASAGCPTLAVSVVNYVARTGQRVSLDEAIKSEQFSLDPHVSRNRVASVLCFPLRRNGEALAIAYLENNRVRGAFREDCWKLLEMLSTQALISLEHARLYESLERQVAHRTEELRGKNQELEHALARVLEVQQQLVTQEKLAALGALTAGIAHEIRNPLNFVTNFAGVALESARELGSRLSSPGGARREASELREQLDVLERSIQKVAEHGARATAIVQGMALHAGRGTGQVDETDLNAVVARSVALATHGPAHGAAVTIEADYEQGLAPVQIVVADISRVLVNVLNNARDALAQKRRRAGESFVPAISIKTRNRGESVEVRIRDNGIGISPAVREKMFLPFFTTKSSGEGTGLGLSISHDIVRAHGGRIDVETAEGEFAEVVVTLPRRRLHSRV
jgi:signal transduction histidine kinase